jgi:hypothetical protein
MRSGNATLIFLHIPKTGGLSLRETLLDGVCPSPTFRIIHPIADHESLASMPDAERESLGLVEGHMYYGVHELLPGPCRYITLLREPVMRLRSWHRYVSRERWHPFHNVIRTGGDDGRALSLDDCVRRHLTTELDNYMTRALTSLAHAEVPFGAVTREMFDVACRNLDQIEFVGTTERLAEFQAMLCSRLGWEVTPVRHLNRTTVSAGAPGGSGAAPGNPFGDEEDERTSRMIREVNRFDLALWERAEAILERNLGREVGADRSGIGGGFARFGAPL